MLAIISRTLTHSDQKMDTELAKYIVRYYGDLMSEQEKLAYRHLQSVMKVTHGRSNSAAQREVKRGPHPLHEMLSEDAEVLRLAADGMDKFAEQTAKRILQLHGDNIVINRCPRCGALAKAPKALQCRSCGNDWHG